MYKSKDICKQLDIILSSITEDTNTHVDAKVEKEADELTQDIKLIIHELIDNIHEYSTDKINELIKDLKRRVNIETNGHKIPLDMLKGKLDKLINNYLVDIYEDSNGLPRSSGDYFKYATTQAVAHNFDKIFEPVASDGSDGTDEEEIEKDNEN